MSDATADSLSCQLAGRRSARTAVNILICIHSPVAMWTIPVGHVERLRRGLSGPHLPARDRRRGGARDDPRARRGVHGADQRDAARRRAAAAVDSQPGGGRRRHAVSGDGRRARSRSRTRAACRRRRSPSTCWRSRSRSSAACRTRSGARRRSEWAQDAIGAEGNRAIAGSRVLVVGLGAIGSAAARRCRALGADVTGIRRSTDRRRRRVHARSHRQSAAGAPSRTPTSSWSRRRTRARRAASSARRSSRRCQPHAILVNVSRGQLVDEAALVEALLARRDRAARRSTFSTTSRCRRDSPFWTLPNVLITPHTSGFRPDHWDAATELFADNLRRFEAGEPLMNVVDKHAGY